MGSDGSPWSTVGIATTLTAAAVAWFVFAQADPMDPHAEIDRARLSSVRDWDDPGRRARFRPADERASDRVVVKRPLPATGKDYEEHLPPRGRRFVKEAFIEALRKKGGHWAELNEVMEYRETILHHRDAEERADAILMLSGNEHPKAVRTFVEAMEDPSPGVRLAAVEALGDYVEDLRPYVFREVLNDRNPEVRFEAVSVVGDMEGRAAMRVLRRALHDPNPDIRSLAASSLAYRRKHR